MRRIVLLTTLLLFFVTLTVVIGWRMAVRAPASPALPPGGDFTLVSADGPVALAQLRGNVVLLYFGYASCPDVCPTSLALTAQALVRLTPAELARVRVLFISVDPERDTPAKLRQYAAHFHANVIGVTGEPAVLAGIAARYGAAYRKQAVDSAQGYVVDHSSFTAVVAPDGRLVAQLAHGAQPEEIVQTVRRWLR
ncbi:MAG: SCO family protein [Gammaproteobacteria bacterium]|nr:MAG: SCO family protein [Gammaproteobacteria bacterium]